MYLIYKCNIFFLNIYMHVCVFIYTYTVKKQIFEFSQLVVLSLYKNKLRTQKSAEAGSLSFFFFTV